MGGIVRDGTLDVAAVRLGSIDLRGATLPPQDRARNRVLTRPQDPGDSLRGDAACVSGFPHHMEDRDDDMTVVECEHRTPSESYAEQLLRNVRQLRCRVRGEVRAILVHGGARKLPCELQRWRGSVDFVQYRLSVGMSAYP